MSGTLCGDTHATLLFSTDTTLWAWELGNWTVREGKDGSVILMAREGNLMRLRQEVLPKFTSQPSSTREAFMCADTHKRYFIL